MKWITLLFIFLVSCKKEQVIEDIPDKKLSFNSEVENSTWVLKEIEFQNQLNLYSDTLRFFPDSIMTYNSQTTSYEFYITGSENRELRLRETPVGYIDCSLTLQNLVSGSLYKHPFNNVYVLSNQYKITLIRIK